MYFIQRKKRTFYIDRVEKPFLLAHFIYQKIIKGLKKIKNGTTTNIRAIRQKLMQKYKEEREEQENV